MNMHDYFEYIYKFDFRQIEKKFYFFLRKFFIFVDLCDSMNILVFQEAQA